MGDDDDGDDDDDVDDDDDKDANSDDLSANSDVESNDLGFEAMGYMSGPLLSSLSINPRVLSCGYQFRD